MLGHKPRIQLQVPAELTILQNLAAEMNRSLLLAEPVVGRSYRSIICNPKLCMENKLGCKKRSV